MKSNNCNIFNQQIQYLGHVISSEATAVDLKNIITILDWLVPKNVGEIQSFMGLGGYYHQFIEGFSIIAYPVTSL